MCRLIVVSVSILLHLLSVNSNYSASTIRQTSNGPVEGMEKISSLGQKYYSFRGIPFAEAPITGTDPYTGEQVDRRFKAPVPLKRRWTDALKVHNFGSICSQDGLEVNDTMGEDCLFLNVYVPADGSAHKTVLVWIFGGGFYYGYGHDYIYGPDFLLSQDNIVVTINYRLGIFGFLNLNIGEYTGNMALKDQRLALKWVHENIEHFSGNKSEVLLFGQSAGAASVHFQMLNKESRSYFQRAFALSGSVFNSFAFSEVKNHTKVVEECSKSNDMEKLMEYLRTANESALIDCPHVDPTDTVLYWSPVIESNTTNDAIITKSPEEIYNNPDEAPVMDAMFSFTAQESLLPNYGVKSSESLEPLIKENVLETTKFTLPFLELTPTAHPKEFEMALKKLREAYFSNATSIDVIKRANTDLFSAAVFNYGIIKATIFQANANKIGRKNTFLFRFNITAELNLGKINEGIYTDAAHSDDLCYIFHCHAFDEMKIYDKHLERKGSHYDLIMRTVKMITNFARTGDPSIEGDTPFRSINFVFFFEFYNQEVGNELKTSVSHDIREQIHYDLWHELDEIDKSLKV